MYYPDINTVYTLRLTRFKRGQGVGGLLSGSYSEVSRCLYQKIPPYLLSLVMLCISLLDISHWFMSRFSTEFMKLLCNNLKYGTDCPARPLFLVQVRISLMQMSFLFQYRTWSLLFTPGPRLPDFLLLAFL